MITYFNDLNSEEDKYLSVLSGIEKIGLGAVATAGKVGSLYIPAAANLEKPQEGEVLASGEGRYVNQRWQPNDVKKGDNVLFGKFAGDPIEVEGETLLVMREEDVLGVRTGKKITPIKSNMLGRVLVKPYAVEALQSDSIILKSDEKAENSDRGFVVSVGDSVKLNIQEGDEILFQKYKPRMLEIDGEMHLVVTEDLIHAVIQRD